ENFAYRVQRLGEIIPRILPQPPGRSVDYAVEQTGGSPSLARRLLTAAVRRAKRSQHDKPPAPPPSEHCTEERSTRNLGDGWLRSSARRDQRARRPEPWLCVAPPNRRRKRHVPPSLW